MSVNSTSQLTSNKYCNRVYQYQYKKEGRVGAGDVGGSNGDHDDDVHITTRGDKSHTDSHSLFQIHTLEYHCRNGELRRWNTDKKLTYEPNTHPSTTRRTKNCHTICIGCEECLHDLSLVINDIDLLLSGVADVVACYSPSVLLLHMKTERRSTPCEAYADLAERDRDRAQGTRWKNGRALFFRTLSPLIRFSCNIVCRARMHESVTYTT